MTQAACKTRRRNRPQLARRYIERVDQPEPVHLALDRNLAPGKREGSKHRVLSRAKYVAKWARRVPCADSSHSGQAAPSRSRTVRINSPAAAAHEAISGDRWQSCSRRPVPRRETPRHRSWRSAEQSRETFHCRSSRGGRGPYRLRTQGLKASSSL